MLIELLVVNLMLLASIWTGINACWGIFVSFSIRKAIKRRRELKIESPRMETYETYGAMGILALSLALLGCLIFGGFFGISIIIESMLIYNIFHSIFLSAVSVELAFWWIAQSKYN